MSKFLKSISSICLALGLSSMCTLEARWVGGSIVISPFNVDVSNGMDASGNATAIWSDQYSHTAHLYSSNLSNAHGEIEFWKTTDTVFSADGRLFEYPKIAIDASWNSVVVWQEFDGTTTKIRASTRPYLGKWSPPVDLAATASKEQSHPQIAITPSGYAVAVWSLDSNVQAATLHFGSAWSSPVHLASNATAPDVGMDQSGNAVAVWLSGDGYVQSTSLPVGGSWSPIVNISKGKKGGEPQLAVNASGSAVVAWITDPQDLVKKSSIKVSTMQLGKGSWSAPALLSTAYQIYRPAVAVDLNGHALVLWEQQDLIDGTFPVPSPNYIQTSYFASGKWSTPLTISAKEDISYNPCAAFDGAGNAYVVWNTYSSVKATTLPYQGNWMASEDISNGLYGLATKPVITVDPSGYSVVNWSGELGAIYAAYWVPEPK